jgi:hypothetical protein
MYDNMLWCIYVGLTGRMTQLKVLCLISGGTKAMYDTVLWCIYVGLTGRMTH